MWFHFKYEVLISFKLNWWCACSPSKSVFCFHYWSVFNARFMHVVFQPSFSSKKMNNMMAVHNVRSKAWKCLFSEMKLCTLLEEAADSVSKGWCAVWEDWMRAEDIGSQRKENQGWAVYPIITEKERVLKATVLGNTRTGPRQSKHNGSDCCWFAGFQLIVIGHFVHWKFILCSWKQIH